MVHNPEVPGSIPGIATIYTLKTIAYNFTKNYYRKLLLFTQNLHTIKPHTAQLYSNHLHVLIVIV